MTSQTNLYYPEQDNGLSLKKAFYSGYMWIPIHLVPNPQALLAAGAYSYTNPVSGETKTYNVAEQVGDCLRISRHFMDWSQVLPYYDTLDLDFPSVDIEDKVIPRDEKQLKAWEALDAAENGVLSLAPGRGKTCLAIKKIASTGGAGIVCVHNTSLLEQWVERITQFTNLTVDDVGIVWQKSREWDKPIVVAMLQTLVNLEVPFEIRSRFRIVVFDEVHHIAAPTLGRAAPMFLGSRIGLSATPDRRDGLEPLYYANVGDVFYQDLTTELVSEVIFAQFKSGIRGSDKKLRDKAGNKSMAKMHLALCDHAKRNVAILKRVGRYAAEGRKVLVLSHRKDHPVKLHKLSSLVKPLKKVRVGVVHRKHSPKERLEILRNHDVSFATFQIAVEGLDVEMMDTLVCCTPYSGWGPLQQAKGRIERKASGKQSPICVIVEDFDLRQAANMCKTLKKELTGHGFTYREEAL